VAVLLAAAPSRAAAPGPAELVVCAPGYPGTTEEAQPSVDALAAALSRAAGQPEGALSAVYLNQEAEGVARLRDPRAAIAMVPVPFYVKHARALALQPRLAVIRQGAQGPLETWTLVARKGRVGSPAALAGFELYSIAGYAPGFVRAALAGWGRLPADVRIVASGQVLSTLRRAAAGESAAVLLDGEQSAALATLPFAGELEVVARSPPIPSAMVAIVGGRVPAARWSTLEKALLALPGAPGGADALAGVRLQGFAPLPAGTPALLAELGEP
jgi:ABC-type phosphate/phosphonate transport system substrate-binding protein